MKDISRRKAIKTLGTTGLLLVGTGAVRAQSGKEQAALRVAHASPDAPAVDVYINGTPVISGLDFKEVTDYLEKPSGEYEIKVNKAGTQTTVFGPITVELENEDYTAVALGEVSSTDTDFTVSIFEDTNGANIEDDESRIRAIHASPDAPEVDVTVNDGKLLFDGIEFAESSGYKIIKSGNYDIEIRPDNNLGTVVYEEGNVKLDGQSTYTVFAVGYLTPGDESSDESFGLVITNDAGAPPRKGRGN